MRSGLAFQLNGFASLPLCRSKSRIAFSSCSMESWTPRRRLRRASFAKNHSTASGQEQEVGAEWNCQRSRFDSHSLTARCL